MGCTMRKCGFGHMRAAKALISLRICAVWSWPSLSSKNSFDAIECKIGEKKIRMILCANAECSESETFCIFSKALFRLTRPISWVLCFSHKIYNIRCYYLPISAHSASFVAFRLRLCILMFLIKAYDVGSHLNCHKKVKAATYWGYSNEYKQCILYKENRKNQPLASFCTP